MTIILRLP